MSTTPLALAFRIAQIIEENSERDIRAAVALLDSRGIGGPLLDYLARRSQIINTSPRAGAARNERASLNIQHVMRGLRESDPNKFRILSEFDRMLRHGHVLTTFEDFKRFGERVSKDFQPRKSRKESIPGLIGLLAQRSTVELEDLIRLAAASGTRGDADEYQRLAHFLIKGKEDER